jgi:thiamine pyrophosphokinase
VKFKILVGNLLVVLGVFGMPTHASAQVEKTFHQVVAADEAYILNFLLNEDYEVVTWSGNTVLIEGIIQLSCCDQNMLSHIIKTGRYDLTIDNGTDVISIGSKKRPPLTIKGLQCQEHVKFKISVPESYDMVAKNQCLLRDSPVLAAKKQ